MVEWIVATTSFDTTLSEHDRELRAQCEELAEKLAPNEHLDGVIREGIYHDSFARERVHGIIIEISAFDLHDRGDGFPVVEARDIGSGCGRTMSDAIRVLFNTLTFSAGRPR